MDTLIGTVSVITMGSVVGSITSMSSSIYSLVSNIKLNKHIHNKDIMKILTMTDVVTTIKVLQAVMSEIPENYINSISIIISLNNVHEIIEQIENELKDLNLKFEYNRNLYLLSNWRSYSFKDNLEKIEELICVLDKRKDNLFKILETFKNLNIKYTEENKIKINKYINSFNTEFEVIDEKKILCD